MTSEQYKAWTEPIRADPARVNTLVNINRVLTYLGYLLYPLLVIYIACVQPHLLARFIAVPGILFVAVSAFRYFFNAPRPYEALEIDPLIHKSTKGRSFPSRHIFSMSMIAMCYMYVCLPAGCILGICTIAMAVIRVLGGVHFPRDVLAGALIAVVGAAIGLWMLPWP